VTEADLSDRLVIDGLSNEWEPDESLLQFNDTDPARVVPEESISDSEWGFNNDINQIHLTWDARFLYVAVDATIWGNNVILLFDYAPGGMTAMTQLNSWRRNFLFQGIAPDMFLATWDGNTQPQVWNTVNPNNVTQRSPDSFQTVATFSQGTQGRSMEAAIPWTFLTGAVDSVFSAELNTWVWPLPPEITELRVVAVLTAGPDGTGGPDSAPDNLCGHRVDSAQQVVIDNWATIPLDLRGIAGGGPDGIPDFDADIRDRVSFRVRPPVRGSCPEISSISIPRSIVSPEQSGFLEFDLSVTASRPEDSVSLSAEIYNLEGVKVRTLYEQSVRPAMAPGIPALDRWDCRDDRGRMVGGGVYILRLVLDPDRQRETRAFSVVR